MSDSLTIYEVLEAVDSRARRHKKRYVTRIETATELGTSRMEVDPVFDEAVEKKYVEEDPKNMDYWGLSPEGQTRLDELLFTPATATHKDMGTAGKGDDEHAQADADGGPSRNGEDDAPLTSADQMD